MCYGTAFTAFAYGRLGGVVVRASDLHVILIKRDHEFDSLSVHCRVASAFHPSGIGKLSTSLLAGVKTGRAQLCRVAGKTVI